MIVLKIKLKIFVEKKKRHAQNLAHLVFVDPLKSIATITEPKSIKMGTQVFAVLGIQWLKAERLPVPQQCDQCVFLLTED